MKKQPDLRKNKQIIAVILLSLIIRLLIIIKNFPIWWDSALHVGVAKYFFSSGQVGILEFGKPLVWPLLLGPAWKMGVDPFVFGKILQLLFSVGSVYLTYLICRKLYTKQIALLAALMFSVVPIFLKLTHVLVTDIASIFFALIAVYLFIHMTNKTMFFAGLFAGIAFMTRFPQGLVIFSIGVALVAGFLQKKDLKEFLKNILLAGSGFLLPVIGFLLFNYFVTGDWLVYFTKSFYVLDKVKNNYFAYYFIELVKQNALFIFALPGLFYFFRKKDWSNPSKLAIVVMMLSFFAFFFYLRLKIIRYLLVAMPFLAIISASGFSTLIAKIKKIKTQRIVFTTVIILLVLLGLLFSIIYTETQYPQKYQNFISYLDDETGGGTLLSTTPMFAVNTDKRIEPSGPWKQAKTLYTRDPETYDVIAINTCDFPCDYEGCEQDKQGLLSMILEENQRVFYETEGDCEYMIFRKTT